MCKEFPEDDEFVELLIALERYEYARNLYVYETIEDYIFFKIRFDHIIEKEIMRYYHATMDRQTQFGHNLRYNI